MRRALWLSVIVLAVATAAAQSRKPFSDLPGVSDFSATTTQLKASLVPSHIPVASGERFHLAVELQVADGWVYYSPDPGPLVLSAELAVSAEGLIVGEVLWPMDHAKTMTIGDEKVVNNVYTGRVVVYVPITVPDSVSPGTYNVVVQPRGQLCEKICIDIRGVEAMTTVQVGLTSQAHPDWTDEFSAGLAEAIPAAQFKAVHKQAAQAETPADKITSGLGQPGRLTLWAGLGLALLAGVTLNIMPCVLPVIPLRILSIVEMAGQSRRRFVTLGLAFAGGMILFFAAIAVISMILRLTSGQAINISDHFQYPAVRIALAMILVALAANLFGVFTILVPSKLAGLEQRSVRQGHTKSAGMGFMMAVLATPCSFAFLLAAMAWAQVQPLWLGTVAILLIGAGMAAPHVLLAAFPGLLQRLPKPGRWMELFKQAMGFLLLPVAIWLLSTLSEDSWPFWVAGYAVVLTFGLWMWAHWVRYDAALWRKLIVRTLAVVLVVAAGVWMLPKPAPLAVAFERFDTEHIDEARQNGRIVLVKVTAAWCTECRVIDYRIYDASDIAEQLYRRGVVPIKADVTDYDSPASQWLRQTHGGAPPMTILYPPGDGPPRWLIGGFSKQELLQALDEAAE